MRTSRQLAMLGATTALLLGGAGIADADQVYNNLDATIDSTAEVMPLNAGGVAGSTALAVHQTGDDGKQGCNLQGNNGDLVLNVKSSDPAVATVSPSLVTFSTCGETHQLTVTPLTTGSARIYLEQVSNGSGGSFDLQPAQFAVNVAGTSNTAPMAVVTGVNDAARYDKGSVPDATCSVTDTEDGSSSFAATLSDVTGDYAADGIGTQTATCEYTDKGGLKAVSQATYAIVDPTAPSIEYTLDPTTPDGDNGWYKDDVTLTWNVTENESPHSLSSSGCDTVTLSMDQLPTPYTCSASSAGGDATPVRATIKRDGTAPSVTVGDTVDGTRGDNGWYTSDVTAHFTAADATSGPSDQSADTSSNGAEGAAVVLNSPAFTDNAGNKSAIGAATTTVKIDHSAPYGVTFSGDPKDGASYYYGQVPQKPMCDANDAISGLASCTVAGDGTPNAIGKHTWTATATDNAGNTASATIRYEVLAWTDKGFYAPVNMAGALNTVKAGSTVPMKFNVYTGSELTDPSVVKSFSAKQVDCGELSTALSDPIEVTTTGGTTLRYDTTGRQFVQNWKTPTAPGSCYMVTMTTQDGSSLSANFKLK